MTAEYAYVIVPEPVPDPDNPGEFLPVDEPELVRVDKETLDPVAEPDPVWWAELEAAKATAADAEASRVGAAQSATASGEARTAAEAARDISVEASETAKTITGEAVEQAILPGGAAESALSAAIDDKIAESGGGAAGSLSDTMAILFRSGGGLTRLYDALANRNTATARLVFLGSSTTAGYNAVDAKGYVHMLATKLQKVYPSSAGSEIPVGTTAGGFAPSSAPGVQVVNLAGGGANSGDYLSPGFINIIGNLKPHMVMHMVGSNDWNSDIAVTTYRANLVSWMDQIDARLTTPCVHVLVHQHSRRTWVEKLHPFTDYRDVLRELAFTFPGRVVHIDVAPEFERLGVPLPDPFDVMDTDEIHLTDRGHLFLTELLWDRLGLPTATAPAVAVVPDEPEPPAEPTLAMITSDSFTGDASNAGTRASDVAFGGSPITPTASHATAYETSGGTLLVKSFGMLDYATTKQNIQASVKVTTKTTSAAWYLYSRRASSSMNTRVKIKVDGTAVLLTNTGAGEVQHGLSQAVANGDVLAVRSNGSVHELRINDVVKVSATVPDVVGSIMTRIESEGATTGLTLDDLKIAEVVPAA
ncbi:SGNH/GDSL hydrolase family protein [Glutamicibacter arilaitensis]|uniref:SGNH/GDSL hydrolase family protein n=1 Tax=Glutamicibacter arilaitensis TaxID=256701 RepID=UPI003850432F